jgi:hypothetical protein
MCLSNASCTATTGREGSGAEWVFIDPRGRDRLANHENTLIPAAGEKWKFVHRAPPPKDRHEEPAPSSSSFFSSWGTKSGGGGDGGGDKGDDPSSDSSSSKEEGGGGARAPGTQVEPTAGDDMDELPWQMIAILGEDMLHNLAGHKRYHDSLVGLYKLIPIETHSLKAPGFIDPRTYETAKNWLQSLLSNATLYRYSTVHNALNCRPPTPARGASRELAPPPEAVTAAARADADDARERGRHADAAALYGEEIKALDFIAAEEAAEEEGAGATTGRGAARAAWTRALLGLRRAEALRRARQLDAARNQLEDVLGTHPRYLDAMFQSALTRLDGGDVQGATDAMRALLCADRA